MKSLRKTWLVPALLAFAGLTPNDALHASAPTFDAGAIYFDFQTCSGGLYTGPGAQGGVGCGSGKFRNGGIFDGIDDAVVDTSPIGGARVEIFTVAAWVKPSTTLGTRTIAGIEGVYKLAVVDGTYQLSIRTQGGGEATVSRPIEGSWWTHVAGFYDGQKLGIVVGGRNIEQIAVGAPLGASAEPFVIGNNPSWTAFAGGIDEVRQWNVALSMRQIHELASMVPRADVGSASSLFDADLTHVSRAPRIPYDANPNVPVVGSTVTWEAHVRNRGSASLTNLRLQWYLDGIYLGATNIASIAPGAEAVSTYSLPWSAADQYLAVVADPQNLVIEKSERNNYRLIRTNALMVGLWVEQSVRDYFDAHQLNFLRTYGLMDDEANSWEDWAQRQIDRFNLALANEALPAGSGVRGFDRVRLDQVIVVSDGSLPLASGDRPTNYPNTADKTVDMMWGFPSPVDTNHYSLTRPTGAFFTEQGLVHELNHARFLVDTYALNLHRQMVDVENGVGYRIYPSAAGGYPVYTTSAAGGMMEGHGFKYAEWEIRWLNQFAGLRPLPGWANFNAHYGLYEYLHLYPALPAQNRLRILDSNGQPLVGAQVYMYQAVAASLPDETYPRRVDNIPELVATVPENGEITIGGNPFSVTDLWGHNFFYCVNFLRIVYRGQEYYSGIDLAALQVAYFRGNTALAIHPIVVPFALYSSDANALQLDGPFVPLSFVRQCTTPDWIKEWRVRNDGTDFANLVAEDVNYYGSCGTPTGGVYPLQFLTPQASPGRMIWQCAGGVRRVYRLDSPTLANLVNTYPDPNCP